jgi:hypothetical protein
MDCDICGSGWQLFPTHDPLGGSTYRKIIVERERVEASITGGGDSAVPAVTPGAPAGTTAEPTAETPVPAVGCCVPQRPGGPAATRAGGTRGESAPHRYPGYPAGTQRRSAHRGGTPRSPVNTGIHVRPPPAPGKGPGAPPALDRREVIPTVARPGSTDPGVAAAGTGRSDIAVTACEGKGIGPRFARPRGYPANEPIASDEAHGRREEADMVAEKYGMAEGEVHGYEGMEGAPHPPEHGRRPPPPGMIRPPPPGLESHPCPSVRGNPGPPPIIVRLPSILHVRPPDVPVLRI